MIRTRLVSLLLATLTFAACSDPTTPLGPVQAAPGAASAAKAAALPDTDGDLDFADVQLRPGVTADLHLELFVDEAWHAPTCTAKNAVLAVPGFAHTAATMAAYAEALFADERQQVCAVLALDLPGHGGSALPEGLPFGLLLLDDYATALLGVIDRLDAAGLAPSTLIGHSQGALVIQLAQDRLVSAGSSLREAGGIRDVQLLAPVPPASIPWAFVQNGTAAGLLGSLLDMDDAVLGPHAAVPDALWPLLFFSNLSGQLASGAPTAATVAASGWNAPAPLYASLQLVGAPPFTRPGVSPGIFANRHGSQLSIVVFAEDQLIRPEEGEALMRYLTGARNSQRFVVVRGAETVHDLFVSDPALILRTTGPRLP